MTPLKAKNLRSETVEELRQMEMRLRKELYDLRVQAHSGRIERPHRMKEIKRDIARLLAVLKERENAQK